MPALSKVGKKEKAHVPSTLSSMRPVGPRKQRRPRDAVRVEETTEAENARFDIIKSDDQ